MNLKYFFIPTLILSLTFSGVVLAKKPEHKGNPHHDRSEARRDNSNRQSDDFSLRGRERAEERHYSKKSKKHKDKKFKHKKKYHSDDRYREKHDRYNQRRYDHNDYDRKLDRYEQQRYQERYQNNPIGSVIDRNVSNVKSKIDNLHRRAIDSIDQKTREFSGMHRQ